MTDVSYRGNNGGNTGSNSGGISWRFNKKKIMEQFRKESKERFVAKFLNNYFFSLDNLKAF